MDEIERERANLDAWLKRIEIKKARWEDRIEKIEREMEKAGKPAKKSK